jgi:hypothetical protein
MSGGSFNYFYSRVPEEIRSAAHTLKEMAEQCAQPSDYYQRELTGEQLDELAEVAAYLLALSFKVRGIALALEKLERVTHDVEWWCSGDSGPLDVIASFRKAMATSGTDGEGK